MCNKNYTHSKLGNRRGVLLVAGVCWLIVAGVLTGCAATAPTSQAPANSAYSDEIFKLSAQADQAYRESRWLDSARHYQQLTEKVPQDAYAWFRLGNTYAQQGAFAQAIHAYEASIERDGHQPKPWFNLSTAHLLNAQQAMQQSWQQLRPNDPARLVIERRLELLQTLMHDRIEDAVVQTRAR